MKLPQVVVISYIISTALGVIRSLGAAGYTVDYFCVATRNEQSKTIALSKFVNDTTEVYRKDTNAILSRLKEKYRNLPEKCVLFPTDDYCASLIDLHRDELSDQFKMPYIAGKGQGAIHALMDKTAQSRLAETCGFPVPKEWVVSLEDEHIDIPGAVVYPCFVKPLQSVGGKKVEMGVCNDVEELEKKLLTMQKADPKRQVLVQEFLNITQEYSMSGVCADQEVVLPAVVKKHRIAQYRRGATLMGELVPVDEIMSAKEALYRFLKQIHYVGMFDLEVMRVGDRLYFGELNLRSGGPNYAYFASGVNLPDMAVKAIVGEPIGEIPEIQYNRVFLNDQDAWEDCLYGFIMLNELKKLFKKTDILLLDAKDDPAPGKYYRMAFIKKLLKRQVRKMLKH